MISPHTLERYTTLRRPIERYTDNGTETFGNFLRQTASLDWSELQSPSKSNAHVVACIFDSKEALSNTNFHADNF